VIAKARESSDSGFGPYRGVRRVRWRFKVEHYLPLDVRKVAVYGLLKPHTEASILLRAPAGTGSRLRTSTSVRLRFAYA
jgi:hypothetical protein